MSALSRLYLEYNATVVNFFSNHFPPSIEHDTSLLASLNDELTHVLSMGGASGETTTANRESATQIQLRYELTQY